MALEPSYYEGRPQALVKHTFLHHYLPALVNKICSSRNTFVYVDGFAGPWQSADDENFSDTSFGIALNAMAAAKLFQARRGRKVSMIAHLVERSDSAFAKLQTLSEQFPTIDVCPYHGEFQTHLQTLLPRIPASAFCFSFIDPKGMTLDLGVLRPLLARHSSEVLINFMFDFVNRFVAHPNPEIVENMNALIPGADWRVLLDVAKANGATSNEREAILVEAFRKGIASTGAYDFVTSLVVQKPLADRTLYHLVFGTRSAEGLNVFRNSQVKALEAQAKVRAAGKSKAKSAKSGQSDLFAGIDAVPIDPSSREIEEGRMGGIAFAAELINASQGGILWSTLWPKVLTKFTIRRTDLAHAINAMRKAGAIIAPSWPSERYQIPRDDQLLRSSS